MASSCEVVPLDIALGLTKAGADGKPPLRWGIMGAGRVCHDFIQVNERKQQRKTEFKALKCVPEAGIVQAVGCRALERSNEIADLHGIPGRYGSYQEVAEDPAVEICYVGMLHPWHRDSALSAIAAGKHVLVEKPFACSLQHAEEIVAAAKEKGVFVMEGMWTRFFPAVEKLTELVNAGLLGDVVALHSDFGFNSTDVADYPSHQMYSHRLGGGGLYYLGPYPVAAAVHAFGASPPARTAVVGVRDDATGVDMAAAASLLYQSGGIDASADGDVGDGSSGGGASGGSGGGGVRRRGVAALTYNMMGESPEETVVIGTRGRVRILNPAHCPMALEVHRKREGRGNVERELLEFPLPPPPAAVVVTGGFNYPNSEGFAFEARAIHRCVRAGLTHCPQYPPEEVLAVAHILDDMRRQIGLEPVP